MGKIQSVPTQGSCFPVLYHPKLSFQQQRTEDTRNPTSETTTKRRVTQFQDQSQRAGFGILLPELRLSCFQSLLVIFSQVAISRGCVASNQLCRTSRHPTEAHRSSSCSQLLQIKAKFPPLAHPNQPEGPLLKARGHFQRCCHLKWRFAISQRAGLGRPRAHMELPAFRRRPGVNYYTLLTPQRQPIVWVNLQDILQKQKENPLQTVRFSIILM